MPSSVKMLNAAGKMFPRVVRRQWPHLKMFAAKALDRHFRDLPAALGALKGRYAGQRCFIMGTGPSLNRMDLGLFEEEHVWGVNKCYLLFDRIRWRPSFWVAVDKRVVPDISREMNSLTRSLPETTFFFPVKFREEWLLQSRSNVYWYSEIELEESTPPERMFSTDITKWVSGVRTVTIAALQLAVYLSFNPIYLIGCDASYDVSRTVRTEAGQPDALVSTQNDDQNHFDRGYFGRGSKWHEPKVDRMIYHYEQARKACDAIGVSVYNATFGGNLEVFPRVDYRELF